MFPEQHWPPCCRTDVTHRDRASRGNIFYYLSMIGLLAQMLVHSWTKWGLKSVRVIKGHAVAGARDVVVSTLSN